MTLSLWRPGKSSEISPRKSINSLCVVLFFAFAIWRRKKKNINNFYETDTTLKSWENLMRGRGR